MGQPTYFIKRSCNIIQVLIFTTKNNKGIECLKELVGKMKYEDVLSVCFSPDNSRAILKDGSSYTVVMASTNARGHKGDIAYVDNMISKDVLDCVIKPCLVYSKLKEEEKIIFF